MAALIALGFYLAIVAIYLEYKQSQKDKEKQKRLSNVIKSQNHGK
jgi:hypothetical protein